MNVFEGGFLGLDNIGPIDRSAQLPVDGRLAQADGTAWMAMYCLNLLEIALVLAEHDRGVRGHGDEVPRALRLHRRRQRSAVGRRDAASTTTSSISATAAGCRCGSARWSACCRWRPRRRSGGRPWSGCPSSPAVSAGSRPTSPSWPARSPAPTCATAHEGRLLAVVPPERLAPHPRRHARRGRVPLAPRRAGTVGLPPRPSRSRSTSAACSSRSTTSRASRPPTCSAATRTGGARCGSRSTTCSSRPCERYARFFGDDLTRRVPHRLRPADDARARWPTS